MEREEENEDRAVLQKTEEKIISRRKLANNLNPPAKKLVPANSLHENVVQCGPVV